MNPLTNFFALACAILALSVVNFSIGPIINKKIGVNWGDLNCEILSDEYYSQKSTLDDESKKNYEWKINRCKNRKTMHNMEYTSFIFNIAIGFICSLLGLYGIQKEVLSKTGIIGMACGALGLILTLVYVIYNGIVYTNYYNEASETNDKGIFKRDGKGAFAELDETGTQYKCYYSSDYGSERALYAKYSDLIKSQYNYNYKLERSFKLEPEKTACLMTETVVSSCKYEYIPRLINYTEYKDNRTISHTCSKLYFLEDSDYRFEDFYNYDLSARFLTVLLLSIITLLCYCGLLFSGFKLPKGPS